MGCMPCLVSPHAKLLKNMGSGEDTRALLDSSPGEHEAGGGLTPEVAPPSYLPPLDPNWELSSSEDGGSELYSEAEDENAGLIRVGTPDFVSLETILETDHEDAG